MGIVIRSNAVFMYIKIDTLVVRNTCADPESFVRGGQTLTFFFSLTSGGRIQVSAW